MQSATVRIWGHPADKLGLAAAAVNSDFELLAKMGGHWAVVVEHTDSTTLIQDPIRSRPLFIAIPADSTASQVITDDISVARKAVGGGVPDPDGRLQFLQLGYVTGPRTLFSEVKQVQAGEWVTLSKNGTRDNGFYRRLHYSGLDISSESELDARFTAGLDTAFTRMLEWVGDRQIVIPLSGGLDSRLLAIILNDLGHKNVVNFTYGVGETAEVGISRTVSQSLGQRWEFITYPPDEVRAAWQGVDGARFIRETYAGASLPHVQDWFAVRELRRRELIDSNAVFLAGHTVVGNMHDRAVLKAKDPVSRSTLFHMVLAHHANIQPSRRLQGSAQFRAEFEQYLDQVGYDGSPRSCLEALQYWNILERKTKYVANSMRGYEHFGYDWALPLLDVSVFEAWEDFAVEPAKDRQWFHRYVARRYASATGSEIGTFAPTNIKQSRREQIKTLLRAADLLTLAERIATARAVARHPMGFLAFSGQASERDVRREILRGGTPMGVWTEQFLADTWAPNTQLFEPQC